MGLHQNINKITNIQTENKNNDKEDTENSKEKKVKISTWFGKNGGQYE